TRYCEFKGNIKWDNDTKCKIIKTILGMSNVRDGGNIIIGVEWNTTADRFEAVGLLPSDATTYDNDTISSIVNNYADTHADISVKHFPFNDKVLVVIEVHEYGEAVICKQEYRNPLGELVLENGAIYTRRHRMPETTKVTSVEMREITEFVSEKLLRREIQLLQSLGIIPRIPTTTGMTTHTDEESFRSEREGFFD
ncbi:MAG: AlbA family DNA-binding domain-containing protein, partial [Nitrososphaeraceae archaeon]